MSCYFDLNPVHEKTKDVSSQKERVIYIWMQLVYNTKYRYKKVVGNSKIR